jgi:RNA polymerase sigma-70 factor, ECF subfamily
MGKALPDVTGLLGAWANGDEAAHAQLLEVVYGELRRLARGYLRRERVDHSLRPTALVHEAYLKLVDQRRVRWHNRSQFFAIAAHLMRRILVDHARRRLALKRGAGARVPIEGIEPAATPEYVDVLALDAALARFAQRYPRQAQLVELRFFGGLTGDEIAAALGIAPISVKRDWALAKAWLFREIRRQAPSHAVHLQ